MVTAQPNQQHELYGVDDELSDSSKRHIPNSVCIIFGSQPRSSVRDPATEGVWCSNNGPCPFEIFDH